jgi:membrane fusion protein (multidrug efflux system)
MDQGSRPERPPMSGPPAQATEGREAGGKETAAKSRGKRVRAVVIALILIAAALFLVWRWYEGTREYVSTDDALVDANRLNVSSKMLGRIAYLGADEGDTVNIGQVLVRLDVSDLRAQAEQAAAGLKLAQENLRLARVALDRAQSDLNRARIQYQNQTMTAEQYEHTQSDYQAALSRVAVAEAQISVAKAQTAVIDTSLANAIIASPLHGVISRRWVLPGDVVQPAQPIFSIYDIDSVWVTANLEETKLARIHLGDHVMVHVDAYPGREFAGRVAQIAANTAAQFSLIPPNNASGNFTKITQRVPVKIALSSDSGAPLLPGMSAVVRVRL